MPNYHSLGNLPPKRHTVFRQPSGGLYYEHLMGNKGFSGPASLLYHIRRPTTILESSTFRTEASFATGPEADPDPTPMDFSAFYEVYLDGRWWPMDARHGKARIGRVLMGRGRDAADVALITSFGRHKLTKFTVITDEIAPQAPMRLSA